MKITADNTSTVLVLLQKAFPESSTTKLKKIIQLGCVFYKNAVMKHPEFIIQKGDDVEYKKYEAGRSYRERPPVPVLFEDSYVLAVFKTMNTAMEGKNINGRQSLLNAANSYVSRLRKRPVGLLPVNYLKSNESGICLLAKTAEVQKELKKQIDTFEKTYAAIVEGNIEEKSGQLEYWFLQLGNKTIRVVEKNTPNAVKTTSSYNLLKQYEGFSYIEIKTAAAFEETVRIHLAENGNPVAGDRKYGADTEIIVPLRLYNFKMSFTHPYTKQKIKIETGVPKSFLGGLKD